MARYIILICFFILFGFQNICNAQCYTKCYGNKQYQNDSMQIKKFSAQKKWEVENVLMYQTPLIMDVLNDDGIPEIIVGGTNNRNLTEPLNDEIFIINSTTKMIERKIKTVYYRPFSISAYIFADINNDCTKELILVSSPTLKNPENLRSRLICYDLNGNILWISNKPYSRYLSINTDPDAGIILTDFNNDGISEVVVYNEVFNAQTGVKLCDNGLNGIGQGNESAGGGVSSHVVACNLDDEPNLELAAGYTVYKVNIQNTNGEIGNTMLPINISFNNNFVDGATAISDINGDGKLDIIVASNGYFAQGPNLLIDIGLFVYNLDGDTSKLLANLGRIVSGEQMVNAVPLLIGKNSVDKDLSIIFFHRDNRNKELRGYNYDETKNLSFIWKYPIDENSHSTGATMFDLNNDGLMEIIYRDQKSLMILNVINGIPKLLFDFKCLSGTSYEKPIVADIDGSGEAKICVTCAANINERNGKLTIFGPPPGQKWAPARRIWHQYAYNPLFINDDGTVPQYQKDPATYKNGKYNNFMVQESLIDEDGNYPVAAASLSGLVSCIDYDINTQQYKVDFTLNNRTDASATAASGVPIAFYNGNPEAGGSLIGVYRTSTDLDAGNTLSGLSYSFSTNDLSSLYMIVNTDKYPIIVSDTSYYDIDECDYTDNLFIAPAPKFTESNQEICQGDSYPFYGNILTNSGTYYHELADVSGCDSVIARLDLQVSNIKTESLTTSACDTYDWNGDTYTTDGTYTHQTLSVNGCDSITTLQLRVYKSDALNLQQQSCDGYTWNGQTYTQSGNYTYQSLNRFGCDSTVTLDLTVYPSKVNNINQAACDAYTWNGQTYTQSGSYNFQTQTRYGCDSTITLDLTISNILRTNLPVTACDNYTWNGNTYDTTGDYINQSTSINGCDSITTLQLTIHQSSTYNLQQSACDVYDWNGQTYTQSGVYTYQTLNSVGCDSTATLALNIGRSNQSSTSVTNCGDYLWNGQLLTTSGTYTNQSINTAGCDSTATLLLTIHQADQNTVQQTACDQYSWNGNTYSQSGAYQYKTQNIFGCDSATTLNLTIHPTSSSDVQTTACDSIIYLGQTLKTSGTYTFNLQNMYGCDSTVTLDLKISGDRQTATQTACETFTWAINNETYTQSGSYTSVYTNISGCDSTYTLDLIIHPNYAESINAEACSQFTWPVNQQSYAQSGIYTLPLKTQQGCDSIITLDLIVHPEFEFRDTVITNQPYLWPINNTTYDVSGIYSESFSTEVSCDSIHYLYLTIKKFVDINFPNIISTGGNNGYFTGYSNNTATIIESLSVYDRWGNLMFYKENFAPNEPQSGWDGRLNGNFVVPGVFTWIASILLPDGSTEIYRGDVTVVR